VRAVGFTRVGGPEVVEVVEVTEPPAPRGDQLLVRVRASSINGTDLGLRRGGMRVATLGRSPFVPGFDLAGEVVARGPEVTAFATGDPVVALLGHRGGAQAELVLVRQGRAALAPRTVPATEAATLPLAGLTALQALHQHGRLGAVRPPARVLVLGASGGIGSFAVLLAKLEGAHVTGLASGPKLAHVRSLGADEALDYREHEVSDLDGRWDLILDASGLHPFAGLRPLLAPDGVAVSTRALGRDALRLLSPAGPGSGPRYAAVMTKGRSPDLARLVTLVDRGELPSVLDRTFALTAAADAHRWAETAVAGKVVLQIAA
jgi:NADPH:quinone reductase-like Zn-dependent oxidoreductase